MTARTGAATHWPGHSTRLLRARNESEIEDGAARSVSGGSGAATFRAAQLPRVELDLPPWRRPPFLGPCEEVDAFLEALGSALMTEDDPRALEVVLVDREAVVEHERMFPSASSGFAGAYDRSPHATSPEKD